MGKFLVAIALPLVAGIVGSLVDGQEQCPLEKSLSVFDKATTHEEDMMQELPFMIEFARFMNQRTPIILQEFSDWKTKLSTSVVPAVRSGELAAESGSKVSPMMCSYEHVCRLGDKLVESCIVIITTNGASNCRLDFNATYPCIILDGETNCLMSMYTSQDEVFATLRITFSRQELFSVDCMVPSFDCGGKPVCQTTTVGCSLSPMPPTTAMPPSITTMGKTPYPTKGKPHYTTKRPRGNIIHALVDAFQQGLVGVGSAIEQSVSGPTWEQLCPVLWFPIHASHCRRAGCAACGPAITTASSACRKSGGKATERCVATVLGEGRCNSCIGSYLQK